MLAAWYLFYVCIALHADTNEAGIRGIFSSHILRFLSIFRTNKAGFVHRGLVPMKLVLVLVIAARGLYQRRWYIFYGYLIEMRTNEAGTY